MSLMRAPSRACTDGAHRPPNTTTVETSRMRMTGFMASQAEKAQEPGDPARPTVAFNEALAVELDVGVRDAARQHRVVLADVARPDHARERDQLHLAIDLQPLLAGDLQIAVGVHADDAHRNLRQQPTAALGA